MCICFCSHYSTYTCSALRTTVHFVFFLPTHPLSSYPIFFSPLLRSTLHPSHPGTEKKIVHTLLSQAAAPWLDRWYSAEHKTQLSALVKQRKTQRRKHEGPGWCSLYTGIKYPFLPLCQSLTHEGLELVLDWPIDIMLPNQCVPNDLGKLNPYPPLLAV